MTRTIATVLLSLAACKNTVDSEGFEKNIEARMAEMGLTPSKVSCSKGVEAKVGAKFTCQITFDKFTYDLNVTVTKIDTESKRGDMDTAWAKGSAVIASKIAEKLPAIMTEAVGLPVTVDCGPEPLLFLDKSSVRCKATIGKQTAAVVIGFDDKSVMTAWELEPKMLVRAKLEAGLTADIGKQVPNVKVTCGDTDLVERPADGNVMCEATDGTTTKKVKVAVTPDYKVERWDIVP